MTKLQIRAFIYQLLGFATLFILSRFLIATYTTLTGLWIPFSAFMIGTLLAPKFQAVKTKEGEKLYMKMIFRKEVKELK